MQNRRVETRLLCADLVDIKWKDKSGRTCRADLSGGSAAVTNGRAPDGHPSRKNSSAIAVRPRRHCSS